jgi:hypothetical protein
VDNIPDWIKIAGLIVGLPIYLYALVRWITSGAARSYFEVKQEFQPQTKKG